MPLSLAKYNCYKRYLFLFLLGFLLFAVEVNSTSVIKVTGRNIEPVRVAVGKIETVDLDELGDKIYKVIVKDLEASKFLKLIPQKEFIGKTAKINERPIFGDWKLLDANVLVVSKAYYDEQQRLVIEIRMWDVYGQKQLEARKYTVDKNGWRLAAHIISNMIHERLLSAKAYYNSRFVFVEHKGAENSPNDALVVMDQDGEDLSYLPIKQKILYSPHFSPDGQTIMFVGIDNHIPVIYLFDLKTGKQTPLGRFTGLTISPRFSPDGSKVALSMLNSTGGSSLYSLDLETRKSQRLTEGKFTDIAGSYSPDGRYILFSSNRSGKSSLYMINHQSKNISKLSDDLGDYYTPVWSPLGDYIAFVVREGEVSKLAIMKPDRSNVRTLSEGEYIDSPTFSPNGKAIAFIKMQNGVKKLYKVELADGIEQVIKTPSSASEVDWSTYLNAVGGK